MPPDAQTSRSVARRIPAAFPALALLALLALSTGGCFVASESAKDKAGSAQGKGSYGVAYLVSVSRPVGGTITSADGQINCGPTGSSANLCAPASFPWTSEASLTATPNSDRRFSTWAGDCSGPGTCTLDTVRNGADKWVVAVFPPKAALPGVYFIVSVAKPAGGTIRDTNGLIACGADGNICGPAMYPWAQEVFLTATPAAGNSSIGWTGDCAGTGPCRLSAGPEASDKSVGFSFSDASGQPIPIIVPGPPGSAGVISINPAAATLPACKATVFTATVTSASDSALNWTVVEAGGGTVVNGIYTAPQTPGTYHVVATSAADGSRTAQATVIVGPEKVLSVAVAPGTGSVLPNGQLAFAATVTTSCGTFPAR